MYIRLLDMHAGGEYQVVQAGVLQLLFSGDVTLTFGLSFDRMGRVQESSRSHACRQLWGDGLFHSCKGSFVFGCTSQSFRRERVIDTELKKQSYLLWALYSYAARTQATTLFKLFRPR